MLTTTYTGSTEARALDELRDLGADVRVSYDDDRHAAPRQGVAVPSTLGVLDGLHRLLEPDALGAGQRPGVERRVSGARNPNVVDKVAAVFESYWNSGDFVPYDASEFRAHEAQGDRSPRFILSPIELRLEPFQERLLEQIALSRERGHHRNLLVSATGTGKTVMAAVDYARLRERLPRARLLFVAHREEILEQSAGTFRHALRDHAFGELWVGGSGPALRARLRIDSEPQCAA